MKHDVNYGLLGLLLLVIVFMILLVIYYYTTYEGLRSRYDMALHSIENVSSQVNKTQYDLAVKEAQLKEKEIALMNYEKDAKDKTQIVLSLKNQSNTLDEKATVLSQNLDTTTAQRDEYARKSDQYYADSVKWKGQYDQTNSQLNTANNRVDRMKSYSSGLNGQIQDFSSELAAMESSIKDAKDSVAALRNSGNLTSTVTKESGDVQNDISSMETTVTALQGKLNQMLQSISQLNSA